MRSPTSRVSLVLFLTALFSAVPVASAHAYIDPGSGSYIFQLIVAGALGAAFAVKVFWRRIWSFVSGLFGRRQPHQSDGTRGPS